MPRAISNTSPLLYLYRLGVLEWLHDIFGEVLVPEGVVEELREGRRLGFEVPNPEEYVWMRLVNPTIMPSEWLSFARGDPEDAYRLDEIRDALRNGELQRAARYGGICGLRPVAQQ